MDQCERGFILQAPSLSLSPSISGSFLPLSLNSFSISLSLLSLAFFRSRFGGFILAPVVLSVSVRKGACTTFSRIRRCHELKSRLTKGKKVLRRKLFLLLPKASFERPELRTSDLQRYTDRHYKFESFMALSRTIILFSVCLLNDLVWTFTSGKVVRVKFLTFNYWRLFCGFQGSKILHFYRSKIFNIVFF